MDLTFQVSVEQNGKPLNTNKCSIGKETNKLQE